VSKNLYQAAALAICPISKNFVIRIDKGVVMVPNVKLDGKFDELSSGQSIIRRPSVIISVIAALAVAGLGVRSISQYQQSNAKPAVTESVTTTPEIKTVTAMGKLEPLGEVIKLSAPASAEGSRLDKLLVKEGQKVKAGDVIAILDSQERLLASLRESEEQVRVAEASLAKVLAGAKQGEIAAQKASIGRVEAQMEGDKLTQVEIINRLEAQWEGDKMAQQQVISRIKAQWEGDKAAQEATIGRLEAELKNARAEYDRYDQLYKTGAISNSNLDGRRLTLDGAEQRLKEAKAVLVRINGASSKQLSEAQAILIRNTATGNRQISEAKAILNRISSTGGKQVNEAEANLNRIAEVRPVDVQSARAEINKAKASVERAKANLKQAFIRAPQDGQVLKINTYPGEIVSSTEGVVDFGQTSQMMARIEVYESDIAKIQPGQKAKIKSDTLSGELEGTVDTIDLQVRRQNVINTDPTTNTDNRVVEVHVKLDEASTEKAARFTNLQVTAAIELSKPGNL
jgi:HlyD family secretion protein